MRLREIVEQMDLTVVSPGGALDATVVGAYCGDLLSHVLANAQPGELWITIQRHVNGVAVAQLAGLAGIILADGVQPDVAMAQKAQLDGVAVFSTSRTAFELAGRLHQLLAPEGR